MKKPVPCFLFISTTLLPVITLSLIGLIGFYVTSMKRLSLDHCTKMAFEVLTINKIAFNATGPEPEAVYLIPIPPTLFQL